MTEASTFQETIDWLDSLYHRPFLPAAEVGLRRASFLLERFGSPQRSFRSVHVAGTTGKGSTTTMIGSILQATGARTGYFRSPHLHSYRERIAVDGVDIDESSWVRCLDRIMPVAESMEAGEYSQYDLGRPTLFEALFAAAALHFRDQGVEWAAVETGMGGRLDATNTLVSDVAVITNVSLEHTRVLGNTVEAIAGEKAAIIKPESECVTAARDPAALGVITERASMQSAHLRVVGKDVRWRVQRRGHWGQALCLQEGARSLDVELGLAGDFQALNAATAFGTALALRDRRVRIDDAAIAAGLGSARVPGRFEIISDNPTVVLDGAHNPAGMHELCRSLDLFLPGRRIVLVVAAMSDKDINTMASEWKGSNGKVIVTRVPETDRAAPTTRIAAAFHPCSDDVRVIDDTRQALTAGLRLSEDGGVLVIAGSLYLVGWARQLLVPSEVSVS
ncbi:MAG TPA: Mur ligase family protein [Chloroflexota bacterium]